jgi:hypothetical protein
VFVNQSSQKVSVSHFEFQATQVSRLIDSLLSVSLPTNSLIHEPRVQNELGDEPKQIRALKQLPQRTPLLSLSILLSILLLLLVWILIEGSVMEREPLRHSLRRTQEERRDYDRRNNQRPSASSSSEISSHSLQQDQPEIDRTVEGREREK